MAVSDELAAALGKSADELRWVDDLPADRQEAILKTAQGQDLSFGKRFLLRTGEDAVNQPSDAATGAAEAFSNAFKVGVPATAAVAGGTFAASRYYDSKIEQYRAQAKEDASKAFMELMTDPELNGEQKREIFQRLADEGFFTPNIGGGDGGPGLPGDLNFLEWVVIFMVLYFAGRALVARMGRQPAGGA